MAFIFSRPQWVNTKWETPSLRPRAISLTIFSPFLRFDAIFILLSPTFSESDRYKILHMTQQHSSHWHVQMPGLEVKQNEISTQFELSWRNHLWNKLLSVSNIRKIVELWYCHMNTYPRVSYQKGPTGHAYTWQIGPFWQDTLNTWVCVKKKDIMPVCQ